ncbi:MAG: nucleotidyltransferase family protein [Clostridia bacterium]|nr:nucleotidyltransferase family protein [Clostridia bacterium]
MKTIAIICEYNPFHNGHAEQLARLRAAYPDAALLCIMSGCFTQRGEPAILPPYDRAEAAIGGGADLVLELPQPWASGSAEFFAWGGVSIADRLGCVDALAFGCETADISAPMRVAERLDAPQLRNKLLSRPEDPAEGAAARAERLYREIYGDDEGMLSTPNNLLAVQYCLALRRRGSAILPLPMERRGSAYHDTQLDARNPSATAVRAALQHSGSAALDALTSYLPPASIDVLHRAIDAGRAPVWGSRLESAILAFYRLADPAQLENCASLGGGLAYRLCAAAQASTNLDELLGHAAAKHFTNTRLRRAILQGMLGATDADLSAEPAWTLLLAASRRGLALLHDLRRADTLPIVTKPADIPTSLSQRQAELYKRAAALYTLAMPTPAAAGEFVKCAPFIVQ